MKQYLGEIKVFAYPCAPEGWVLCDGQALQIQEHSALYSLLGTNYGGDGRGKFCVPDLRDKGPHPNIYYCMAVEGEYPPQNIRK